MQRVKVVACIGFLAAWLPASAAITNQTGDVDIGV